MFRNISGTSLAKRTKLIHQLHSIMKKLLNLSLAAAFLASCAPQQPTNQFTLNGTISGVDGQYIYMEYALNDSTVINDSILVSNGTFEFKGTLNKPCVQGQIYMGDASDWQNKQRFRLFLEPKTMTIAIDAENFSTPEIQGSLAQAQEDSLNAAVKIIQEEAADLYKALEAETDHEKAADIREQLEPYQDRMRAVQVEFVKTHPNSFISPYYMRFLMGNMNYSEIKAIYDSFSSEVKQYGGVEEIEKELAALANVQPGAMAPDIRKEDVNGDTVSISALRGKVVLVDFWASWCVPCRKSFPHVKALYEKYHKKGFEVFCVGDNDSTPDKWKEAIKQDGVEKFYHVLRGLRSYKDENGRHQFDRSQDVSDRYAIHYLPTKYLIDREGKIVGKFNDEELDAKLKEMFEE